MTKYGVSHRSVQPSSSGRKGPRIFEVDPREIFADFRPQRGPHFGGRAVDRFCEATRNDLILLKVGTCRSL